MKEGETKLTIHVAKERQFFFNTWPGAEVITRTLALRKKCVFSRCTDFRVVRNQIAFARWKVTSVLLPHWLLCHQNTISSGLWFDKIVIHFALIRQSAKKDPIMMSGFARGQFRKLDVTCHLTFAVRRRLLIKAPSLSWDEMLLAWVVPLGERPPYADSDHWHAVAFETDRTSL